MWTLRCENLETVQSETVFTFKLTHQQGEYLHRAVFLNIHKNVVHYACNACSTLLRVFMDIR